MRSRAFQKLPRPHSVDFLDYENKFPLASDTEILFEHRPKSSLDINFASDNYFYSEANYAEKMRQSVNYLQRFKHLGAYPKEGNIYF